MYRYCIIPIILLLLPVSLHSQSDKLHFNIGIKAGVQAITYNDPDFEIEGYIFDRNNIQSNKIGYTLAPFLRVTKGRFYIQSEAALGISRHSFDFKDAEISTNDDSSISNPVYSLKTYCLQVPVLFGYSFIRNGKFGMSIFTGPRTKFTFTAHDKQDFKHFKHDCMQEILQKKTWYWEIGLGVNIHNVFFDFVYDIGITDASKHIISGSDGQIFKTDRRDNQLSFSVGMMF